MEDTRLKRLIRAKGYSFADFAHRIGVHPRTLSRYLSGESIPDAIMAVRISNLLHRPVNDIWGEGGIL